MLERMLVNGWQRWGLPLCTVLIALLSGCISPATAVVLTVDTDTPPDRTMTVDVRIQRAETQLATSLHWVRGQDRVQFPLSFTVNPRIEPHQAQRVQVDFVVEVPARSAMEPTIRFTRTLRFSYTRNRTMTVRVFLPLRCGEPAVGCPSNDSSPCTVARLCELAGLTCGNSGECVGIETPVEGFDRDAEFATPDMPTVPRPDVPNNTDIVQADRDTSPDVSDASDAIVRTDVTDAGDVSEAGDGCVPACVGRVCGPDGCGGLCGPACRNPPNASSAVCQPSGQCGFVCDMGFADCDGNGANGCESSLGSAQSCGRCGVRCADPTPMCDAGRGQCVPSCPAPGSLCGLSCVNLHTDVNNCGSCGSVCPARANSVASCVADRCLYSCLPTHADCNMDLNGPAPGNGCEVVLGTAQNCRMCGETCSGGTPNCVRQTGCVNGCAPLTNCSNNCIDTTTDPLNCGACGMVCPSANARARCTNSVCGLMCNAGFADCDMMGANGCEANLQSDSNNCGACGVRCGANSTCQAGRCACTAGFGDCDNGPANGCETPLNTISNCNGCGLTCGPYANATATCTGAVNMRACGLTCAAGFRDCDSNLGNGCEVNIGTDRLNCGGCGVQCAAMQNCVGGMCTNGCGAMMTQCGMSCFVFGQACGMPNCPAVLDADATCTMGLPTCGLRCEAGNIVCSTVGVAGRACGAGLGVCRSNGQCGCGAGTTNCVLCAMCHPCGSGC
jgi:hypothetical protein